MCRMIGRLSAEAKPVNYELLQAPRSLEYLSRYGWQYRGGTGKHRSGCGIAWVEGAEIRCVRRSAEESWNDSFVNQLKTIETPIYIAHNRLATSGGGVDENRAHPFTAQTAHGPVAFCHNGDADMFMKQAQSEGRTDSELLFNYLLAEDRFMTVEGLLSALRELAAGKNFSSLSGLLITPSRLCGWRVYAEKNEAADEARRCYYTLHVLQEAGEILISSEAIDDRGWRAMNNRELIWVESRGGQLFAQNHTL